MNRLKKKVIYWRSQEEKSCQKAPWKDGWNKDLSVIFSHVPQWTLYTDVWSFTTLCFISKDFHSYFEQNLYFPIHSFGCNDLTIEASIKEKSLFNAIKYQFHSKTLISKTWKLFCVFSDRLITVTNSNLIIDYTCFFKKIF